MHSDGNSAIFGFTGATLPGGSLGLSAPGLGAATFCCLTSAGFGVWSQLVRTEKTAITITSAVTSNYP